jgi:hypothetical protein
MGDIVNAMRSVNLFTQIKLAKIIWWRIVMELIVQTDILELVNGIEEQQGAEEMKVVNTLIILLSVVSRKLMNQKRR